MSWRTVVVSSRSKLELKNNYLVIRGDTIKRVHLDEISVLIIENTGCAVTVSLLATLWEKKVAVLFCDSKRNPGAQLLPFYNSFDCSARISSQINWDHDFVEIVWAAIIKEKIRNQALVLKSRKEDKASSLLTEYMNDILSGDVTNREGHAAKVYFNALFGSQFSRSDECYTNYALNYGYGIILSAVNREIVANGYLTQLGIFHRNVFNQFNLGSDLMEPFRPLIDNIVLSMETKEELDHFDKMQLVDVLNKKVTINRCNQTVINAISIYVKSVLDALDARDLSLIRFYNYGF